MRIATFAFRSIPLRAGCAGADKFALELYPRLVARGHQVVAYNRLFKGEQPIGDEYKGVITKNFYTPTRKKGFDTFAHSAKATWDIIRHNTADVVHMQNGGNSPFALILRLFGKKVFLSQDGVDWKRDKWPWYAKAYLWATQFLTACAPHAVIIDNIFCKADFEKKFNKTFDFIPFGSEVKDDDIDESILEELGLKPGEYFLFVGRFIPDKGLQYLIPAFERLKTDKKLVLVGGAPNPSDFERKAMSTKDPRIMFPGFLYGAKTHGLMKNCYAYVQPSDIEGLSPVVLENMALGTPIICSDIVENKYVVGDTGLLFEKSNTDDLLAKLQWALENPDRMRQNGVRGRQRALAEFSWDAVTEAYEKVFLDPEGKRHRAPPVIEPATVPVPVAHGAPAASAGSTGATLASGAGDTAVANQPKEHSATAG
ncbi:MAG: glycosyltransferase family 4 protein [Burkholderiaceae bacterium]